MELSAYALERKNVRMLNFACLAASLLLTAGVGAGYVSTPSRYNAPQLVDGVTYYGYDAERLEFLSLNPVSDFIPLTGSYPYTLYFASVAFGSDIQELEIDLAGFGSSEDVFRASYYPSQYIDLSAYKFGNVYSSDGTCYMNVFVVPSASYLNREYSNLDLSMLSMTPVYANGSLSHYQIDIGFYIDVTASVPYFVSANYFDATNDVLSYVPSYEGTDVTDAITDGLGAIVPMGGALVTGFDAIALDSGALTPVVTFGFVLMGLGISVGIVKKCFNWVTGRHGM